MLRSSPTGCTEGGPRITTAYRPGTAVATSLSQEGVWIAQQLAPTNGAFNVIRGLGVVGPLDAERLAAAMRRVLSRHEVLSCRFDGDDDGLAAWRVDVDGWCLERQDADVEAADEDAYATDQARAMAGESFGSDLSVPVRLRLFRTAEDRHLLLVMVHHIAVDGWSFELVLRDLLLAYGGSMIDLPAAPSWSTWAAQQREFLDSTHGRDELAWWCRTLEGVPSLRFTSGVRVSVPYEGGRAGARLDQARWSAIHRACMRWRATPFMGLVSAFGACLQHRTQRHDFCIGTSTAGRVSDSDWETIGLFATPVPLRLLVPPDSSVAALLEQVRRVCLTALGRPTMAFEHVLRHLRTDRDASHPVFQAAVSQHDYAIDLPAVPAWEVRRIPVFGPHAKYDMTLESHRHHDGREVVVDHRVAAMSTQQASHLVAEVCSELDGLAGIT